jgi:hypothetical protein
MSFFYSLILFDVLAILIISAMIYRLSISRPEDQTRTDMAAVVQAIVDKIPRKAPGNVRTPGFEGRLEADLVARMVLTSRHGPASGEHAGEHPEQAPHRTLATGRPAMADPGQSEQTA